MGLSSLEGLGFRGSSLGTVLRVQGLTGRGLGPLGVVASGDCGCARLPNIKGNYKWGV